MSIFSIILIGLGLAMDAFAVSLTMGMRSRNNKETKKIAIKCGVYFGMFQGVMPFIGWALGKNFADYISNIDHWIAFILLGILGGKMIFEAIKNKDEENEFNTNNKQFLLLAIATSIDALAVGISFAFLKVNILKAILIISITTFILGIIAVVIGKKFGDVLKSKTEIVGGIILILIGSKILIEHLNLIEKLF